MCSHIINILFVVGLDRRSSCISNNFFSFMKEVNFRLPEPVCLLALMIIEMPYGFKGFQFSFWKDVLKFERIEYMKFYAPRKSTPENKFGGANLETNRPFPSCHFPLFQNESSCKTFHMKMSLICIKMNMQGKGIFIRMVPQEDSFWRWGKP